MDLSELKETLRSYYECTNQRQWLDEDKEQFISPLPSNIWNGMVERNPTVVPEVKKLNSSTALAVNYFQMLPMSVEYEVDVAIPLILSPGKGHPAMIDVRYETDGETHYVESKFLEPYYSQTHEISPSYLVEHYYDSPDTAAMWIDIFKSVQIMINNGDFCYYDINQMLKHLLAIYRTSPPRPVILSNMIWRPEKVFFDSMKSKRSVSYLKKRSEKLTEEMCRAQLLLTDFVQKIDLDCRIHVAYYNDTLQEVSTHENFVTFAKKYLL